MLLAGPALALAIAACPTPSEADAAVRRAGAIELDADLGAVEGALAACGPAASTPELRARAEQDRIAVRRVAEVERRAALLYPAGGRGGSRPSSTPPPVRRGSAPTWWRGSPPTPAPWSGSMRPSPT